jgi:hypothetical protein
MDRCGSHLGAVGGGTKIGEETEENSTITHPHLCSFYFGSICILSALLHLALVVSAFFLVVVFAVFWILCWLLIS